MRKRARRNAYPSIRVRQFSWAVGKMSESDRVIKKFISDPKFRTRKNWSKNKSVPDERFASVKSDPEFASPDLKESDSSDSDGEDIFQKNETVQSSNEESDSRFSEAADFSTETEDFNYPSIGPWALEEDEDVPENDEVSSRLAVCNIDFHLIGASELYSIMAAVLPENHHILSVKVYPSEFGKSQMEKEKVCGPIAATIQPIDLSEETSEDSESEDSHQNEYEKDKLRAYELNRLRYYFAVVTCDSEETAKIIYKLCDGVDIEHSSSILDLRYIPDDMTFDETEVKSECTSPPEDCSSIEFVNRALQHSSVMLTWDQIDPRRLALTTKKFSDEDGLDQSELHKLVATPSCSEVDDDEEEEESSHRYKKILNMADSDDDGKVNPPDDRIEVTWKSGLENPGSLSSSSDSENEESGNDAGAEANDFFDPFLTLKRPAKNKKCSRRTEKKSLDDSLNDNEEDNFGVNEKVQLEILTLPDDPNEEKPHYSYKKKFTSQKGPRSKKARKLSTDTNDSVEVDIADSRFSAIFHAPEYSVDPSSSSFRNTKSYKKIIDERVRRREAVLEKTHKNK